MKFFIKKTFLTILDYRPKMMNLLIIRENNKLLLPI